MKHPMSSFSRFATMSLFAATAGVAQAHTGHEVSGLMSGLMHPMGWDHLLAMLAVGVWSAVALPTQRRLWGPAIFLMCLTLGAVLGMAGLVLPFLEQGVAFSVALLGLAVATSQFKGAHGPGLVLIAAAGTLHGLAHGAEAPGTDFAAYAIGFLLTSAALHLGGVWYGLTVLRAAQRRAHIALSALGTGLGAAGMYLLSQV